MNPPFYIRETTTKFSQFFLEPNNYAVTEQNWAFLDLQNLYKGVQEKGWKIKWDSFRKYLATYLNVTKAVAFMGYLKENTAMYNCITNAGFEIEFREVIRLSNGKIDGGNTDVDLAYYVMDNKCCYDKAIIVADDGDYYKMIRSLVRQNKLKLVLSSHPIKNTSKFIKRNVEFHQLLSIHSIRNLIEYRERN